jgi:hypothetical protein
MFIAKLKKSVLGLIVGAAIAGLPVVVAATASADTERNPFGALHCNCQNPAPAGIHENDINQGLLDAIAARPGRPVPMQHNQSAS